MRRGRERRGFALVAAVLATVLIGAMVTAVVFATTEDTRLVSVGIARQSGMMAAESAVTSMLTADSTAFPASVGLSGQVTVRVSHSGNSVVVYVTRLDSTMFWIVADVVPDANHSGARRRVGVLARRQLRADGSTGIAPISQRPWSELF